MTNKRVVIFDLDGTAIPSEIDGLPSQRLQNVISDNLSKVYFCAATGRSWEHAKKPVKALSLYSPCIVSGGSQIINPSNEEMLWQITIPEDSLRSIYEIARIYDKKIAIVTGTKVSEPMRLETVAVENIVNTAYMFDIRREELDEIVQKLSNLDAITASPTRSWYRQGITDLHITHREATKEHAIKQLCQILRIPRETTIGIGDGLNDIHLFNAVNLKVAMGNAEYELKQRADMVIGSIKEDGLAVFLEQNIKTWEQL